MTYSTDRDRPADRDRTLARVRTTSAVSGIGALVTGGVLAAWLGHVTAADKAATSGGSSTSVSNQTGGGLTAPGDPPTGVDPGTAGRQPPVTSGGS